MKDSRGRDVVFYGALATLTTALAVWLLGLLHRPWDIPIFYRSDGLFFGGTVKGTLENGWYENNPSLGAPSGQVLHDFPQPDNTQYLFCKIFDLITDDWALTYNLTYLLTFPLAAVTAAWFFRLVGARLASAFGFGILFAFAPYHFIHGQPHLALSQYFPVPLAVGLVFMSLTGQSLWARRESGARLNPFSWLSRRSVATIATMVLLGTTSSYYSMFVLLLLGFTMVAHVLRRHGRALVGAGVGAVFLAGSLLANLAPDLYYRYAESDSVLDFTRQDLESEIYALKFASLVFPTHWTRIGSWAEFRLNYDATFPLPAENPSLGVVAMLGFVFLLLILPSYILAVRGSPAVADSSFWQSQRTLSSLTIVAFFFGTIGGLGTLFAILVTPNIRAWNRITIVIALLALAAAALWLDRLVTLLGDRWGARTPGRSRTWAAALPCALVVVFGLYDQTAPTDWGLVGNEEAQWASDADYGAAVQVLVPEQGMVVQFPFLPYPESPPVNEMNDYDPIRGYLHTTGVRWTYGGLKGVPRSSWTERLADLPVPEMLVQASAAGAEGIHVDRFGYPGRDTAAFESALSEELGDPAAVSTDSRFAFFDMSKYNELTSRTYTPTVLSLIGSRTLSHPEFFWQDGFAPPTVEAGVSVLRGLTPAPAFTVANPSDDVVRMEVSFTLRPEGAVGDAAATIAWPDGQREEVTLPIAGRLITRTLDIPVGRSSLGFAAASVASLTVLDLRTDDVVLVDAVGDDQGQATSRDTAQ